MDTDKINKTESVIIDQYISTKQAMWWYFAFNIVGLALGVYLAFIVGSPILSIIFIYSIYSLWTYSKKFKNSLLIGNIQVAFLTALCILNIALYDILPNGIVSDNGELITFKIITYYAGFSAIITFIREIVKDIEDYTGDLATNAKTLVITHGVRNAKQLVMLFIVIILTFIAYIQYFQYSVLSSTFSVEISYWGCSKVAAIYTLFLQFLLVLLMIKTRYSETKEDFHFVSTLSKIIMLFGILSIPLFTYLHLR